MNGIKQFGRLTISVAEPLTLTANWEAPSGSQWGPVWRRGRTNYEAWLPARVADRAVLWQRCPSCWDACLDDAPTDRVSVPQADRGTEEDDVGEEAKRDGTTAASDEIVAGKRRKAWLALSFPYCHF